MLIRYVQAELGLSIEITTELVKEMEDHVDQYFPNESGGIFIGHYSEDKKKAVIKSILVPEVTQSTPVRFKRVTKKINKELGQIYLESEGKLIYLGEWHSHPMGPSSFSGIDYSAICQIASNSDVKIDLPVLCIISGGKSNHESDFFIFHNQKLYATTKEES